MVAISKTKATKIKQVIAAAGGRDQQAIAARFGVSRSIISDMATGRRHADVPWPSGYQPGGTSKPFDPTNDRILELESEVLHLKDECNKERAKYKASAKSVGLFKSIVREMDLRVRPFRALPAAYRPKRGNKIIQEHLVMHLSDGHHDQVIKPEECGGRAGQVARRRAVDGVGVLDGNR
jgi:hypothetical protein